MIRRQNQLISPSVLKTRDIVGRTFSIDIDFFALDIKNVIAIRRWNGRHVSIGNSKSTRRLGDIELYFSAHTIHERVELFRTGQALRQAFAIHVFGHSYGWQAVVRF